MSDPADVTATEIAFYSPLKPADHPTPSGDRLMARQLIQCLGLAGFKVDIASRLRVFVNDPHDQSAVIDLEHQASNEIRRLRECWTRAGAPAIWFCYHPYYKSPDLIGPQLCKEFDIPYVTAEASYSPRRTAGAWQSTQGLVLRAIRQAAVNICFTNRDRDGLLKFVPDARLALLRPFIDAEFFVNDRSRDTRQSSVPNLVTVAMMRSGDKMKSYEHLASALLPLTHLAWTLSIVGDGPQRDAVHALFADFPDDRINWHGQLDRNAIAEVFAGSVLYPWPGCGEAYGLAYLEAQAAALPVVAFDTAGVPAVVDSGYSGILTPAGDDAAYASAVAGLLLDQEERSDMSAGARLHVQNKHSLVTASQQLGDLLNEAIA